MKKRIALTILVILILFIPATFAHSGRTDSNGGHYNRSTGEYHYHHGYSAHQHPGGVCPYEVSSIEEDNEEEILRLNSNDDSCESCNNLKRDNEQLKNSISRYKEDLVALNVTSINQLGDTINTLNEEKETISNSLFSTRFWCIIIMIFLTMLCVGLYTQNHVSNTTDEDSNDAIKNVIIILLLVLVVALIFLKF